MNVTKLHQHASDSQSYRVERGGTTYYITEFFSTGSVYVSQVYISRRGRRGERRVPEGSLRDALLDGLAEAKRVAERA